MPIKARVNKPHKSKKTKQKRKNQAAPSFMDFLSWLADARAGAGAHDSRDLCGASTPHSRAVLGALRSLHHYQTSHCEAEASMFSTEDYKFLIVVVNDEELIKSIRATMAASGKIVSEPGVIEGKPN